MLLSASLPASGSPPAPPTDAPPVEGLEELVEAPQPSTARRADPELEPEDEADTLEEVAARPMPALQPVPVDALPASRTRALGAVSGSARTPIVDTSPFSVVLTPDGVEGLQEVAEATLTALHGRGLTARIASLDEAGRPDVLLLLAPGPRFDAWYCDPGNLESPRLASVLVNMTGLEKLTSDDDDDGAPPGLDCDQAHQGRARSAVVLLQLPESSLADAGPAGAALAEGLQRYFGRHGAAVRQARSQRLVWPARGPITSHYEPSHPLGIDIGVWDGDIVAATDGSVAFAGGDRCCSYGLFVVIDGADGIRTLYAHFETLLVETGDRVRQGQRLGTAGCTGHCLGPHLHFEVIVDGRRQDPLRYLP